MIELLATTPAARLTLAPREKCPYSEFLWSVFSLMRTECGETWSIFPYSVRMRGNADQEISECGHFSGSVEQCP